MKSPFFEKIVRKTDLVHMEQVKGIEPSYQAWEAVELTFSLHLITVANP